MVFVGRIRATPRPRIGRIVATEAARDGSAGKAEGEERKQSS